VTPLAAAPRYPGSVVLEDAGEASLAGMAKPLPVDKPFSPERRRAAAESGHIRLFPVTRGLTPVESSVAAALGQGRNCLVLTNWTGHLQRIAVALRALGHDPVILKGGMGAKDRATALARLNVSPNWPQLRTRRPRPGRRWPSGAQAISIARISCPFSRRNARGYHAGYRRTRIAGPAARTGALTGSRRARPRRRSQAEELDGVLPEDALFAGVQQRELVRFLDASLEVQPVAWGQPR